MKNARNLLQDFSQFDPEENSDLEQICHAKGQSSSAYAKCMFLTSLKVYHLVTLFKRMDEGMDEGMRLKQVNMCLCVFVCLSVCV